MTLLQQDISEPYFVYEFGKIILFFSTRQYKIIWQKSEIIRQTIYLVFHPIVIDDYSLPFICSPEQQPMTPVVPLVKISVPLVKLQLTR